MLSPESTIVVVERGMRLSTDAASATSSMHMICIVPLEYLSHNRNISICMRTPNSVIFNNTI